MHYLWGCSGNVHFYFCNINSLKNSEEETSGVLSVLSFIVKTSKILNLNSSAVGLQ